MTSWRWYLDWAVKNTCINIDGLIVFHCFVDNLYATILLIARVSRSNMFNAINHQVCEVRKTSSCKTNQYKLELNVKMNNGTEH